MVYNKSWEALFWKVPVYRNATKTFCLYRIVMNKSNSLTADMICTYVFSFVFLKSILNQMLVGKIAMWNIQNFFLKKTRSLNSYSDHSLIKHSFITQLLNTTRLGKSIVMHDKIYFTPHISQISQDRRDFDAHLL